MKRGPVEGMSEGSAQSFIATVRTENERDAGRNDFAARAGDEDRSAVYGNRNRSRTIRGSVIDGSTDSGETNNYER